MKNKDVGEGLVPSRYPKRKSIRLKNLDYAQPNAVFFITLCSLGKRQIFVRNDFNPKNAFSFYFLGQTQDLSQRQGNGFPKRSILF